jgi:hypothetical protein
LHESQAFCWATREGLPILAWMEMAAESSRVYRGL